MGERWRRAIEAVGRFFFAPASPVPLATLRIGIAATLLLQAASLAPQLFELYGSSGILQEGIGREGPPVLLGVDGFLRWTAGLGIDEYYALLGLGLCYVGGLLLLLLGITARSAAFLAWLSHMVFMEGQSSTYGVDFFSHVALFFLIWFPSAAALSIRVPSAGVPGPTARLALRTLQIYLCIAYFASGAEKILGEQWRNGEAIWRSVMLPSLRQFDMSWMASTPWLAWLAGWGTIVIEMGYAVFIWPRRTRYPWLILTISLHVGIAVFLNLWFFSLVMIVLSVSAFGISPEPKPAKIPAVDLAVDRPRAAA